MSFRWYFTINYNYSATVRAGAHLLAQVDRCFVCCLVVIFSASFLIAPLAVSFLLFTFAFLLGCCCWQWLWLQQFRIVNHRSTLAAATAAAHFGASTIFHVPKSRSLSLSLSFSAFFSSLPLSLAILFVCFISQCTRANCTL